MSETNYRDLDEFIPQTYILLNAVDRVQGLQVPKYRAVRISKERDTMPSDQWPMENFYTLRPALLAVGFREVSGVWEFGVLR